jgi:hypothetical protein
MAPLARRSSLPGEQPFHKEVTMGPIPRPRLTYANVVASLALFLALGGGAYAATALPARSVGSRELKANAVVRAKIKANAVNASKVADGSLTGADIKEATLGPVPTATHSLATAALDSVTYKSAVSAVGATGPGAVVVTTATATATCNPGQRVISGGVRVDDPTNAFVIDGFPDANDTAWTVRVGNGGPATVGFSVIAICTAVNAVG